jgi:hypothetical protein
MNEHQEQTRQKKHHKRTLGIPRASKEKEQPKVNRELEHHKRTLGTPKASKKEET